jgi:hypothetical protein
MANNYVYNMFYEHLCRVCYRANKNEPHDCYSKVKIKHDEGHYSGTLCNPAGATKWVCTHSHTSSEDALTCAKKHLQHHREGTCVCSYYAKPIPEWLKNQKTTQLYILSHPTLKAWKVGVTGSGKTDRLQQHYSEGWSVKALWAGMAGVQAYTIEQKILQHWRTKNILPFLTKQQMPQSGWTETASILEYDNNRMNKLVEHIIKEAGEPKLFNF